MASNKLSALQQRFVDAYLLDPTNATQCAIDAGYGKKNAGLAAHRVLAVPKVQEAIAKAQYARSKRTAVDQDRVLLEIARIAFSDPRRAFDAAGALLPINTWPDDVAAAIASVKITQLKGADGSAIGETAEVKFWDKNKSLDLAARHLGMLNDKLDIKGNVTIVANATDLRI